MGIAFAGICALSWSIGIILFKVCSERIDPIGLNIYKNLVGLGLMLPTWYILESQFHQPWFSLAKSNIILFASGFIGIGIADSLYLSALKKLGAGRTAIVDSVYIPFVALVSFVYLSEEVSWVQLMGIALVVGAILSLTPKKPVGDNSDGCPHEARKNQMATLACILSVFATATGIVVCKPIMQEVPLIWLVTYRLGAGVIGSFLFLFFFKKQRRKVLLSPLRSPNQALLFLSAFMGTYLAMMFWIAGFKYEQAAVAAVVNQSSTLMVIFMAAVFLKEKLSKRKLALAGVATLGVIIVSLG